MSVSWHQVLQVPGRDGRVDDVLKEAADEAGIPYEGSVEAEVDEPEASQSTAGDYLFTWETKSEGESEFLRVQIADVTIVPDHTYCEITVKHKRSKRSKIKVLLAGKRWDIKSTSSTESQVRALNRWKIDIDWNERLTWVAG
jgi:hypothetical protein